jgi:hypothetical protein
VLPLQHLSRQFPKNVLVMFVAVENHLKD